MPRTAVWTVNRVSSTSEPDLMITRTLFSVEHEQFRDAVLGKPADIVTMADGAHVVQVARAVLESAANGSAVSLA